jgi:DNA gyrase subunit A
LTQLERASIDDEYEAIIKDIKRLRDILGSEALLNEVIKEEFVALKAEFGDARRTVITDAGPGVRNIEDFIPEEQMVVTISHAGYIKRTPVSGYKSQSRGGKGVTATKNKEDDFVERLYVASTHSYLLFLTNRGRLYWLKVHEILLATRTSKGKALVNVIPLSSGEKVTTVLTVDNLSAPDRYVFMATKKGVVKRMNIAEFQNPRKSGINALKIKEDDELVSAALTDGSGAIILSTREGKAICFKEEDIRSMGRQAAGVRGIRLKGKDLLVAMDAISADQSEVLMTVTDNGLGKRTPASEYNIQARGGGGVITLKTPGKSKVVGVFKVNESDRLMLITNTGRLIMFNVSEVSTFHRRTKGVRLMRLGLDETVVDVALLPPADEQNGSSASSEGPVYNGLGLTDQERDFPENDVPEDEDFEDEEDDFEEDEDYDDEEPEEEEDDDED